MHLYTTYIKIKFQNAKLTNIYTQNCIVMLCIWKITIKMHQRSKYNKDRSSREGEIVESDAISLLFGCTLLFYSLFFLLFIKKVIQSTFLHFQWYQNQML